MKSIHIFILSFILSTNFVTAQERPSNTEGSLGTLKNFTSFFEKNGVLSDGSFSAGYDVRLLPNNRTDAINVRVESRVYGIYPSDAPTETREVGEELLPFEVTFRFPVSKDGFSAPEIQEAKIAVLRLFVKKAGLTFTFLEAGVEKLVGLDTTIQRIDILSAEVRESLDLNSTGSVQIVVHGKVKLNGLSILESNRSLHNEIKKNRDLNYLYDQGGFGLAGSGGIGIRFHKRFLAEAVAGSETTSVLDSSKVNTAFVGAGLEAVLIKDILTLKAQLKMMRYNFSYRASIFEPAKEQIIVPRPSNDRTFTESSIDTVQGNLLLEVRF